jgi:hypothetical protein
MQLGTSAIPDPQTSMKEHIISRKTRDMSRSRQRNNVRSRSAAGRIQGPGRDRSAFTAPTGDKGKKSQKLMICLGWFRLFQTIVAPELAAASGTLHFREC